MASTISLHLVQQILVDLALARKLLKVVLFCVGSVKLDLLVTLAFQVRRQVICFIYNVHPCPRSLCQNILPLRG